MRRRPRLFRLRPTRGVLLVAIVAALIFVRIGVDFFTPVSRETAGVPLREGPAEVVRVVDGDTLILRQQATQESNDDSDRAHEYRVRLLGIDTPETVKPNHPVEPWGPEATAFAKEFLGGGQVRVRLDKRRLDKYDRFLAYVYVGERMLNEELVRAGLARVAHYPGDSDSIARLLERAEREASKAGRGIWSTFATRNSATCDRTSRLIESHVRKPSACDRPSTINTLQRDKTT